MDYRVPKRDLVTTAQIIFQARRIRASRSLPMAEVLIRELQAFRMKVNLATGHDSYESWRERDHDDLVLALCLAIWLHEKYPPVEWVPIPRPRRDILPFA